MRRKKKIDFQEAISAIDRQGVLLVFPVKNKLQPASLWQVFYPKSPMVWKWSEDADNRVVMMWDMMKRLSEMREIVYAKWYQGRACFFSHELFTALLCLEMTDSSPKNHWSPAAGRILDILESDSPLSTKELKLAAELRGKDSEPEYTRAMKQLFGSFRIVGCGEVDDGAFPSLSVGATQSIYENLWTKALGMKAKRAKSILDHYLPEGSELRKFYDKSRK